MSESELYFRFQCEQGLTKRKLAHLQKYQDRLKFEINTICTLGFCDYFLIVSDIVQWALQQNIPTGPGRGSCVGSLVSYCLGITHIDPIKYDLIFERFLNPARTGSWPDIDLDFCELRRHEVLEYVKNKYNANHVAHIGTFGTMKAKGAIRDVARTLGLSYQIGDKLANLILEPIAGKAQPLSVCYEKVPELFKFRHGEKSDERLILEWAEKAENRIRAFGTHASGIVISPVPITQILPLYPGKDKSPTAQFEMFTVEKIGLIKFDFLALRALTTIQRCIQLIKKQHDIEIDPLSIPIEDNEVYQMLQTGDTAGLFQLEGSSGIRELLVQIRPNCLEDINVLVAVYRPGPLGSNMLQHYLKVRAGQAYPSYTIPELEPILSVTGGMLIYQEQVLQICRDLAGFTLAEADLMRRAIGKKKPEEMQEQYTKFIQGMTNNGIHLIDAEKIWHDIDAFSSYGFNKSHSVAYSFITYQMAYLKTHYPLEFMCACLISDSNETDKVIQYISYAREKKIPIYPPSINHSNVDFSIDTDSSSIRFGLSAIKNLGKPVIEIIEEREKNGPFVDILDFANRVDLTKVNKLKLESLVLAGALDNLKGCHNRASMIAAIEEVLRYREEKKRYDSRLETYQNRMEKWHARNHSIFIWNSMLPEEQQQRKAFGFKKPNIIKTPVLPELPILPNIPILEELSMLDLLNKEKELLGFFVSGHPLDFVKQSTSYTIQKIKQNISEGKLQNKTYIQLIAIPSLIKEITTKTKKQKMAYLTLEDKTGILQGVALPDIYIQYAALIDTATPALYKGVIEIVEGDIEKIGKLIISQIQQLKINKPTSQIKADLDLQIDNYHKAIKIATLLKALQGQGNKITINFLGKNHTKWTIGTFECKTTLTELKELIGKII